MEQEHTLCIGFLQMYHANIRTLATRQARNIFYFPRTTPSRSLEINNLGSTRRLCKNFEQENAFMDMLEGVTHYEMDADHMLLLSNGTLVAILKAVTK